MRLKFKYKFISFILLTLLLIGLFPIKSTLAIEEYYTDLSEDSTDISEDIKSEFKILLEDLFSKRNLAVLDSDSELLKEFYDLNIKVSLWAYESEAKKTQYLVNWSEKQGVKFTSINSIVRIRKAVEKEPGLYGVICDVATDFNYAYTDSTDINNKFRLGTNHYLNLRKIDDKYIITKEWYTDPFADSLDMNKKSDDIRNYILSRSKPEFTPSERLQKAIDYAHTYCGVSEDEEFTFKYNKNYKDHNPDGGDCANFASQILYEGGGFKKNSLWNYSGKEGTKAWLNAQGFKNYMVSSGRASYISKGTYAQIYKDAFNLKPGDFVAYEKKDRITHISTVTGYDSKGYPLVTCHNTNRLLVPYDLGWSNPKIKFHLIHVHY